MELVNPLLESILISVCLKFLQTTTTTETTPETTEIEDDSVEIVVQTEAPSNETSSTLAEIPFKGKIFSLTHFFSKK